jgi:D-sedoheptulose 7-phosphate isomerase
MVSQMNSIAYEYIKASSEMIHRLHADPTVFEGIIDVSAVCLKALKAGNKLLFIGNGGSAADCQHMAGEYVSRFAFDRPGLSAIALTTDTSILTAIGNDYGYDQVFSRQVQAIGCAGDVLFAYTTSGASENIIAALETATSKGIITVLMSGNSDRAKLVSSDYKLLVPGDSTPHIQECHAILGHCICSIVEMLYFRG